MITVPVRPVEHSEIETLLEVVAINGPKNTMAE
jgi:hypothetical protein